MNWFQRLFTTGYFFCLVAFSACCLVLGEYSFYHVLPVPFVGETYAIAMFLLGLPAAYIVLRDLTRRSSLTATQKRGWAGLFLMCWPSVLVYLVRYEWRAITQSQAALERGAYKRSVHQ